MPASMFLLLATGLWPLAAPAVPPPLGSVLRSARSADGIHFFDSGELRIENSSSPSLLVSNGGKLLAIFDQADTASHRERTYPAVIRSRDGGRSWSRPRAIRIDGLQQDRWALRRGSLIRAAGGVRAYFTAERHSTSSARRDNDRVSLLISAVTADGRTWRPDPLMRLDLDPRTEVRPVGWTHQGRVHLFLVAREWPAPRGHNRTASPLSHYVSRDGREFALLRPLRFVGAPLAKSAVDTGVPAVEGGPPPGRAAAHSALLPRAFTPGSVVSIGRTLRMYGAGHAGVVSFVSNDGHQWAAEDGLRLTGGWDPAAVRLPDGSFLMLYCASPEADFHAESPLTDIVLTDDLDDEWTLDEDAEEAEVTAKAISEVDNPMADELDEMARQTGQIEERDNDAETLTSVTSDDGDVAVDEQRRAAEAFERGDWLTLWNPLATGGFPPKPDFKAKVDYVEWYRDFALEQTVDNAWDAYAAFMPTAMPTGRQGDETDAVPAGRQADKPEWPREFDGMFTGTEYDGPPAPWDPAEHPQWEESNQRMQDLIQRYVEASRHEGYAPPVRIDPDTAESASDYGPLLLGILLPELSRHRLLTKAILQDAWRLRDGRVSSERTLQAWETVLRSAAHMETGATLIESLVGLAQRHLVRQNARWAIRHGVLSPDELQNAIKTLRELDRDNQDWFRWLHGEYAWAMELTQYLFSPPAPDGVPQLNTKRARHVATWELQMELPEGFFEMSPHDAYATVDALDSHYRQLARQMNIGYPDVRGADIAALEQLTVDASPIAELVLPAMSRAYVLRARGEAARRATQLVYAVHIFKERHGRFPQTLNELPPEFGGEMRIDPFTGDYFGYRLTDEGPMIYSFSENARDDGGVHAPRWDDRPDPETGSDDYVFWPPQHTR